MVPESRQPVVLEPSRLGLELVLEPRWLVPESLQPVPEPGRLVLEPGQQVLEPQL